MLSRREFLAAGAALLAAPTVWSQSSKRRTRLVQTATDRFDLVAGSGSRFRILQLTDTHFGTAEERNRLKDARTERLIRKLVEEHEPDFLFHTGDFINNDRPNPEFGALRFMNSLGVPWSLAFGNHDHPNGKPGQKSLEEFHASLGEAAHMGYAEQDGRRDYCFRIDLRAPNGRAFASLFVFNTGDPQSGMKVNESQTRWFLAQMEADKAAGVRTPVYVMQHIPMIQYHEVYEKGLAVGRRGETVCFELDRGEIFRHYADSGRVRAVLCGHDHVNDYLGALQSVNLVYGRCSGFSGYGDWERGARILDLDPRTGRARTKVVLAKNAKEKPEWSLTLQESELAWPSPAQKV